MKLLKKLCTFSPSGREEGVAAIIAQEMRPYCDEITTDVMGNLICHKKGPGKKLMLSAHMDEIGFIVTLIDEKGYLHFAPVGGHMVATIINQRVRFANGTLGVICPKEEVKLGDLKLKDCYIDIGAKDQKDAETMVQVGDMAVFCQELVELGHNVMSRALDNKAGCYIAIKAMERLKESKYDIYAVFTVQEELGLRGARTAAYALEPDVALALDVTFTGDVPGCEPMAMELHKGAAIKLKDGGVITHPKVKQWLMETAKEQNIPYQLEVMQGGSTDVGAISLSKGGVMCGGISLPCRYTHSASEMASKEDLENCVKLLAAAMERELEG